MSKIILLFIFLFKQIFWTRVCSTACTADIQLTNPLPLELFLTLIYQQTAVFFHFVLLSQYYCMVDMIKNVKLGKFVIKLLYAIYSCFALQHESTSAEKTVYYVKLNCPWELLVHYAEELNLRAPLQVLCVDLCNIIVICKAVFQDDVTIIVSSVPFNFLGWQVPKFSKNYCAQSCKDVSMCPIFYTNPVLKYTNSHISRNFWVFLKLCLSYAKNDLPSIQRFIDKNRFSESTDCKCHLWTCVISFKWVHYCSSVIAS